MEPLSSLPRSHMRATCSYPEPARSSPYHTLPTTDSCVPRNFFFWGGVFNKFNWGQRERGFGGGSPLVKGFRLICKWVKPVFLLGCYGCIFHGTGNFAQFCQNFGVHPPTPQTPVLGTPQTTDEWICVYSIAGKILPGCTGSPGGEVRLTVIPCPL
jgi:hypothetical protein